MCLNKVFAKVQESSRSQNIVSSSSSSTTSDTIQFGGCLMDAIPKNLFESMPAMWLEPYDDSKKSKKSGVAIEFNIFVQFIKLPQELDSCRLRVILRILLCRWI